MRYDESDRRSSNVEDRRRQSGGFRFPGGRGMRVPIGRKGGLSITTLLIIGAIMLLFGMNPLDLLRGGGGMPGGGVQFDIPGMPSGGRPSAGGSRQPFEIPGLPGGSPSQAPQQTSTDDEKSRFIKQVLADTEDVWHRVFKKVGKTYREPKLVLFRNSYPTACGHGQAAMGPFYCPLDQKIYIDLAFYEQLKRQFKAPGDFAQAYVVAHEVGHHVQTILGIAGKVQQAKSRMSKRDANALQVRMELQADCLAGVWANVNDQLHSRLEPGDIKEGINAAKQIGDDMIQKRQTGRVVPEAFTHGSAEQRVRWFMRGFDSGEMQVCETFKADQL